jgi:hypothetical protein
MLRLARILLALSFFLAMAPAGASAQALPPLPDNCKVFPSTSRTNPPLMLVCKPTAPPNGDLVVFAHGYVPPGAPLAAGFYQLMAPDGKWPTIEALTGLGYYFIASSYRKNGLAVLEGVQDTREVVAAFKAKYGEPGHVYIIGPSEGGLVATLAVEQYPNEFAGGLAVCAPIGDFREQVNYLTDFRVIFDYFFPKVLPGTAIVVPSIIARNWGDGTSGYVAAIALAVMTNAVPASQLFLVTGAATDPDVPSSPAETAVQVLWYSAFATMEARAELHGQPFDNRTRPYLGSTDNVLLNRLVPRYTASPSALTALQAYTPSGVLVRPLVTMHNLLDPVVPYSHDANYAARAPVLWHFSIPIERYGHCNFTLEEMIAGFGMLVSWPGP